MLRDLSATMRMCLESVEQAPGTLAKDLPGGSQTVRALMARGKVEIGHDAWRVSRPEHAHEFKPSMHMDGCHWFSTTGRCECGAHYSFYAERSLSTDPYSAVWMEMGDCARCVELQNGARARGEIIISRPERVAA
jgi:hypothetical protein